MSKLPLLHPLETVTVEFYKKALTEQVEATGAFEERVGLYRSGRNPILIDGDWVIDIDTIITLATALNPDMIVASFNRKIGGKRYAVILATTPDGFNEYRSTLTADDNAVVTLGEWEVTSVGNHDNATDPAKSRNSSTLN